ncbi:MAG: nucleotidyltransferase [Deltaproteobacteria bacterium]|jgi:hypothetical protein|nr:nucleotidyltransferase [Deltaproteobacteria bacterium]
MDKDAILARLKELGRRLANEGIEAEMVIFGGAAMALAYNERRMTRDIDAVYEPYLDVQILALDMRKGKGFSDDWLNSSGNYLINPDTPTLDFLSLPGLNIKVVTPDFLLATKIRASRKGTEDFNDTKFLIDKLGIKSKGEALTLVYKFFPAFQLEAKHERNLSNAFEQLNLTPSKPDGKPRGQK